MVDCLGQFEQMIVVHGDCPTGADRYAKEWVKKRVGEGWFVSEDPHPAYWEKHGKSAGFIRNEEMVNAGAYECLAFINNESRGATHTATLAQAAGIPTQIFRSKTVAGIARRRVNDVIVLNGVQLIWKNFAGKVKQYNENGKRQFAIRLDEETYTQLLSAGWEPKRKEPREVGEDPLFFLPVTVRYFEGEENARRNPRIFLITESTGSRNKLDEDMTMLMDFCRFTNVDVTLSPYNWGPIQGKYGVSAYLKTCYATLEEDPLDIKYADYVDADAPLAIENVIDAEIASDTDWMQDGEQKAIEG